VTEVWITIGVLSAGTAAIKAVGPATLGGRSLPTRVAAVIGLFAPALLAALVVVGTIGGDNGGLVLDARLAGVGAAVGALALRLPMAVVVLAAAAAAASVRALGG